MNYDSQRHHRRSIRLEGYDYTLPGAYFVTICTAQRRAWLASIEDGQVHLSRFGEIVQCAWQDLPHHYPHVSLDAFCIIPNHVHGIIIIHDPSSRGGSDLFANRNCREINPSSIGAKMEKETRPYASTTHHGLPEVVRAFKSFSARRINQLAGTQGTPFWQRNYYERIIRDENELNAIRTYIQTNPMNWEKDQENR